MFMSNKRLVLYLRPFRAQSSKANLPVIVLKPSQVVGYKMIVVTSRTFDNNYSFRIGLFTDELLWSCFTHFAREYEMKLILLINRPERFTTAIRRRTAKATPWNYWNWKVFISNESTILVLKRDATLLTRWPPFHLLPMCSYTKRVLKLSDIRWYKRGLVFYQT